MLSIAQFQELHYNSILAIKNTQIQQLQSQIKSLQEKVEIRGKLLEKAKRELQSSSESANVNANANNNNNNNNNNHNNDFKFKFNFNPMAESVKQRSISRSRTHSFTTFKQKKFKPPSSSLSFNSHPPL